MAYYIVHYDRVKVVKGSVPCREYGGGKELIVSDKLTSDIVTYRGRDPLYIGSMGKGYKRAYRINKQRVRDKMNAFFELKQTFKFFAFYTISFPFAVEDSICFRLFNIWLTRCRKRYGKFTYIWVAERQRNGTLHYHLLTNKYMDIRFTNAFMKRSLMNVSHEINYSKEFLRKYNGVQVRPLTDRETGKKIAAGREDLRRSAFTKLAKYMTKYVTKNQSVFEHLAWHESRDLSILQTKQYFSDQTGYDRFYELRINPDKFVVFSNDFCTTYFKKDFSNFKDVLSINEINQMLYDDYFPDSFSDNFLPF